MEVPQEPKRSHWPTVVAAFVVLILVILLALFVIPNVPILTNLLSNLAPGTGQSSGNTTAIGNPSIANTSASITFPSNYQTLANYALGVINRDRTNFGLSNVTQSPIESGQQHADSMLYFDYFSHWDTQGYKPYMRYTLLNGTGYVEENVAYEYTNFPTFMTTSRVEGVISSLEYQMMYNDSACCQNGHRQNILNQYHNRVSIGIAYDSTHIYFVEDFENYYATISTPIASSNGQIHLTGSTSQTLNPTEVLIFYDKTPQPTNTTALGTIYYGPYNQGSFVGGVLPPCSGLFGCQSFQGGVTVYASTWQVSASSINIQFSLNKFTQADGKGVYTVYLVQGSQSNPEFLTSISIWIS